MEDDVFAEIKSVIKDNGSIKDSTRNRLMLIALTQLDDKMCHRLDDIEGKVDQQCDIRERVQKNSDNIDRLIRNNIIMWVKNNKALSAGIGLVTLLLWKTILPLIQEEPSRQSRPFEVQALVHECTHLGG